MEHEDDEDDFVVAKKVEEVVEEVDSGSQIALDPKVGPIEYRMRPSLADTFKAQVVRGIIRGILYKTLHGKKYNLEDARNWSRTIADSVNRAVRELGMPRYKHVVQVSMGQQLGSGARYIAKCSWDADCDNHASDVFSNASMFCVCTVFGIYLY